jgi:hypothetical protein
VYGFSRDRGTLSFDLDLRYWHSKGRVYHDHEGVVHACNEDGVLAGGTLYYRLPLHPDGKRSWFITAGASFKTSGYTKGYPLAGGPSFTIGAACAVNGDPNGIVHDNMTFFCRSF